MNEQSQNPYGAPTEGLGQTITFQQPWAAPLPQFGNNAYQINTTNVQFAPTSALGQTITTNVGSPEVDALMGLVGKVIGAAHERAVGEARAQRFIDGMQMAQAGKTAAQIAEEQPWYANVFGGTADVVAGATVYNKTAQVTKMLASLDQAPDALAQMDATTLRGIIDKGLRDSLIGDPVADAAVMQEHTRHVPALTSRWVRLRTEQQQRQALIAFGDNLDAQAKMFSGAFSQNLRMQASPDDNDQLAANYLSAFNKPDGMSQEAWQESVATHAIMLSEAGQFHALSIVEKLLPELPAKARLQIARQTLTNAHQLLASPLAEPYHEQWAKVKVAARNGKVTPEQVVEAATALNKKWFEQTGSPVSFVSGAAAVAEGGTAQHYIDALEHQRMRELEKAAKELGEAENARLRAATLDTLLLSGNAHMIASSSFKDSEREELVYRHADVLTSPTLDKSGTTRLVALANLLATPGAGGSAVSKILHTQVNNGINAGPTSAVFKQAFDTFKRVRDLAPAGLAAYPDDLRERMSLFAMAAPDGIPVTADGKADQNAVSVWTRVFSDRTTPLRVVHASDKDVTSAVSAMQDKLNSMLPEALSQSIDVNSQQFKLVASSMRNTVSVLNTLGTQVSGEAMVSHWVRQGGRAIGGFMWRDPINQGVPTDELFRQGDTSLVFGADDFNIGTKFRAYVDDIRKRVNNDAKLKDILIQPNGLGTGVLVSIPGRADGEYAATVPVAYSDIGKYLHNERAVAEQRKRNTSVEDTNKRIDEAKKARPGVLTLDELRRATF